MLQQRLDPHHRLFRLRTHAGNYDVGSGTDCIVNSLARQAGLTCTAVIRFPDDEYCNDFRESEKNVFWEGFRARALRFELPGERTASDIAYENASQVIVDHSDLILAIWDGLPSRGPEAPRPTFVTPSCEAGRSYWFPTGATPLKSYGQLHHVFPSMETIRGI
jgi:hypothetical protein